MIVILDTSAAVEILLQRPEAGRLGRDVGDAEWVLVPALYTSELCNVFWKYHQFQALSRDTCERAISQGLALPDTFSDDFELDLHDIEFLRSHKLPLAHIDSIEVSEASDSSIASDAMKKISLGIIFFSQK